MKRFASSIVPVLGLLALGGFVLFSYLGIRRDEKALLDDLHRRARVIAQSLTPPALKALKKPPTPDEEDLAERLSSHGRTLGILLCARDGDVVARSAALADLYGCSDVAETKVEKIDLEERNGISLHRLTVPLKNASGEAAGTLTVVHDTAYIQARVRDAAVWTAVMIALFALLMSALTYFLSRRSFQRSVGDVLKWMKASKETPPRQPPSHPLLAPVAREMQKMAVKLQSVRETARELSQAAQVSELWNSARLKAHAFTHFGNRTLTVVSNREPYMHVRDHSRRKVIVPASGLVTALDPVLRSTAGLWIAHGAGDADREVVDRDGKVLVPPESPSYTLKRVWLTKEEEDRYYYGFSNEALWPLCHLTHHRPLFEEADWRTYEAVNEKFARAVLAECGAERPFVLVQDYHFTCLPRQIRRERPDAVVGLFWHIPWPTPEAFQICPWKSEILEGMLGADFIGFHLPSYVHNFLNTVNAVLPVRIDWDRSAVLHANGTTFVKPFPISIQPWAERSDSLPADFDAKAREIRHELDLGDATVVVSVDRLDYTKGIPERLEAISLFFERNPQFVGKAVFVQLGAPSRVHIPKYRDLVTEIERKTDEVNWKWGTEHWKPVLFLKAHHDPATVYTFLRMADACIVSSLADGMNLVAKEYVASREEGGGALILSEFAGTAREFADALLVNPYDRSQFAEAIRTALEMPPEEQRRRMLRLRSQVAEKNVYRWAADLLTEMSRCAELTDYQKNPETGPSQATS